ncbi:head-tail connector protein [Streptomyces sp. NPDC101455]|uniref:head-tail connector protein n=1 Tax=Streptomyces sp. NPDC101455 TaxID=3366142 RepID=UPI003824DE19
MSIVTLEEAKKQLKILDDDTAADEELQAYVDAITTVVEEYKHEVIEPREVREDLEVRACRRFRLWNVPVLSLTSVTSVVGSMTWDVSTMRPNPDTGLVRVLSGPPVSGLVEVVFQAGYSPIPDRYKRGALVIIQHVWETQRGKAGPVRGGVVGPEELHSKFFYSVPRKALEWLGAPRPVVG